MKIVSFSSFTPLFSYVKDLITKKVLLSSQSKDGLYNLLESSTMFMPQAFLSTSTDVWHRRLSHSSSHILSLLVSNKKVICTFHHLNFHCQVCPLGKSSRLSLGPTGHKCLLLLNLFLLMFGPYSYVIFGWLLIFCYFFGCTYEIYLVLPYCHQI